MHAHCLLDANPGRIWHLGLERNCAGDRRPRTRRILGDYVLTEHDVRAGRRMQHHLDIVALCDHTLDMHGPDGYDIPAPNGVFGIPYRCLCPQKVENLLVTCRALSCSHVASSSVRLQRTLMKTGEAGGVAAAMAARQGLAPRDLDVKACRPASASTAP